jgi:hypothetical protein
MPCKLLAIENCSAISTGKACCRRDQKKIQGALLSDKYLVQRDKTTNGTILKRHIKQL